MGIVFYKEMRGRARLLRFSPDLHAILRNLVTFVSPGHHIILPPSSPSGALHQLTHCWGYSPDPHPLLRFGQTYFTPRRIHERQHHSLLTPLGPANLQRKHVPEALHSHTWHLVFHTQTHTAAGLLSGQTAVMFAGGEEQSSLRQVRWEAELHRLTGYHQTAQQHNFRRRCIFTFRVCI